MSNSYVVARRAVLLGTAASVFLAGCGLSDIGEMIGPPPPLKIYLLRSQLAAADGGGRLPWQMSIAIPDAPASIDTVRIALNPTPSTLDYYADAAWPDRTPVVIQSLLIEAFENAGRIAVARDTDGVLTDYVLRTELREFQARYPAGGAPTPDAPAAAPEISIRIDARIVAVPERRVLGNISVTHNAQAQGNEMDSIIAAFNEALSAVLGDIVTWSITVPPAS